MLFHHDPYHDDDFLDSLLESAREDWAAMGNDPQRLTMAAERLEVETSSAAR